MSNDSDWTLRSKCRGLDPNIFVPNGPGGTLEPAKAICNGTDGLPVCPVKQECKEYGEATNSLGVFGGEVRSSALSVTLRNFSVLWLARDIWE